MDLVVSSGDNDPNIWPVGRGERTKQIGALTYALDVRLEAAADPNNKTAYPKQSDVSVDNCRVSTFNLVGFKLKKPELMELACVRCWFRLSSTFQNSSIMNLTFQNTTQVRVGVRSKGNASLTPA